MLGARVSGELKSFLALGREPVFLKGARDENRRILLDMDVLRAERDALKSQVLNLQLALLERSQQLDVYIGPISVSSLDHYKWKAVNERGGDAKS